MTTSSLLAEPHREKLSEELSHPIPTRRVPAELSRPKYALAAGRAGVPPRPGGFPQGGICAGSRPARRPRRSLPEAVAVARAVAAATEGETE